MSRSPKALKIASVLESRLEDPALRPLANTEFQKHAAGFRASFRDTRAAVDQILARVLYEIAWFQEVPFVVDGLEPPPADGRDSFDQQEARLRTAVDRLETNAAEELCLRIARAVREKLVDKLRVAIPKYIGAPGELSAPHKLALMAGGGDPVRGQLRTVADAGYRPAPLDRRTGEAMGGDAPKQD